MKKKEMSLRYKIIDGLNYFNIVENMVIEKQLSIKEIEEMLKKIHNKEIDLISISENIA